MKRLQSSLLLGGATLILVAGTLACRATTIASPRTVAAHHAPRVEAIDVEHYAIELRLLPEQRSIEGRCTVRFVVTAGSVDELTLELEGLEVRGVEDGRGNPLLFDHSAGELEIELPGKLLMGDLGEVVIDYGGRPLKGLWFVEGERGQVRQVFTQGECIDSHWWFPCLDYPADRVTSEIRVTMPREWVGVAAGERIDLLESGTERTEHWRMSTPHPTYLTTLCAGEFHLIEEEWDGIPLQYLADQRYGLWMTDSFEETDEILSFFSDLTGKRYPYDKYAQACVGNFPFGGMENISATTMTEMTLTDELGQRDGTSHGLVAHEAAHQWFGDLLTCADWSEIWLNEGFATYLTHLYYEHSRGIDEFRVRMRNAQISYTAADVGKDRRPTVYDYYKDPFDLFFDGKAYAGGAARLHLLRFELGDALFFEGLRLYVAENEGRAVRTGDLQAAMETVSKRDLEEFFNQWFYSAGYPEIEVRWIWDEALGQVELTLEQIQGVERGTPVAFHFPVDVELRNAAGQQTTRLEVTERRQTFTLPSPSRPIWVRFDKHSWLPARVASHKTASEWMAVAAEDDDVNGRRDAVEALGLFLATEEDPARASLFRAAILRRLRDDDVEAVRLAAVAAFGRSLDAAQREFLIKAVREDISAQVREEALNELTGLGPDAELAAFAQEVFDEGYSWDVRIAAAGLYASAAPTAAHDWIIARTEIPSPHSKLRAGLIGVLSRLDDERILGELLQLASREDLAGLVRGAAVRGIGVRGRQDTVSRDLLLGLLDTNDYRLRQDTIDALGGFRDAVVLSRLRTELATSPHSRERRKLEAAMARIGESAL
jgi:aminopeptidase N